LEAAAGFVQPLIARVGPFQTGELPASKGFITVTPAAVQLSALRKKADGAMEIRVVEVEGRKSPANVELGFPVKGAHETNLLGAKTAEVEREGSKLRMAVDPWKIRTFEITP
jgi:alpha-mannosidase